MVADRRSDEVLLSVAFEDEDAFAVFYGRYERPVAAFFVRAAGSGELALDLTAEVFAEALASAHRFGPELGRASAWLFGIARNVVARSRERGRVEDRARRRLGMPVLAVDDELIERIEASASDRRALELLERYGRPARRVDGAGRRRARLRRDRRRDQLFGECRAKAVSRGLATLRARLKEG